MTKAGDKIIAGALDALEYAKGNTTGSITHEIEVIDVKEVRKSLGMTQAEFADTCQRRSKNPPLAGVKVHHHGGVIPVHLS